MEELAIKIAETLDISVQGAIDMYPVIRGQFIWYQISSNVNIFIVLLVFITLIFTGVNYMIRDETDKFVGRTEELNEDWVNINKALKVELYVFLVLVVIGIVTNMITPFLAPDVMIIKNFLG